MAQYRFWGAVDPRGRTKLPLQASVPVVDTDAWTLQVYEPIDSWGGVWGTSAAEFAEALRPIPDTANLTLRINSPGGEVAEATAIANMLRERSGQLTVKVDGWAASAASYLAVLGDPVIMGEDSRLMIHKPWGVAIGNDDDMFAMGDLLASLAGSLARAYQAKAGGDVASWLQAMAAETWYTPDEAVAAGLADSILGQETAGAGEELPAAAAARGWDLTGLARRAPAASVPPVVPPVGETGPELLTSPAATTIVPPPSPPAAGTTPPVPPGPGFDPAAFRAGVLNALKGA